MLTKREKIILELSCALYEVESVTVLTSRCRYQHIGKARELAARMLRLEGCSLTKIGAALNRDHSTIVYILKKKPKEEMQDMLQQLREQLPPI